MIVKPWINVNIATIPKSYFSKKCAKIDSLNMATNEVTKVEIDIHFAPEIIVFLLSILLYYSRTFIIFKYSGHSPISFQDFSLTGKHPTLPPRALTFSMR